MGLMPRSAGSPAWRVTGILVLLGAAFGPATVHGQEAEFLGNDTQGTDVELKIGSEWDSIFNRRDGPVRRNQAFRTGSNPDGYLLTKLVLYMNDFASSDHVEGGRPELRVRLRSVHNRTTTRDPHSNTSEIFAFAIPTPSSAEAQDFVPSSAATETQKTLQPDTWYAIDVHQAQVTPAKENNVKHIDMVGTASDAYSSPEGWQVDGEHLRKDGPSNRRWSRDQNSFRMKIFATRISDATTVTLMADPGTIAENGGQATIRGSVAPAPEAAFTVDVAATPTADTAATVSDYTLSDDTTLSFAAGATASTGTVTLTAVNDDTYTGDRSVTLSGTSTAEVDILSSTVAIEEDEPEPAPNRAAADPTHNSAVLFWVFEGRPDGSDVEYQVSANDESFGNWTEIPLSRPGQSHGSQYEVPDLAPSTEYTFKLRYKRGSSTGPEVEASATTFEPFTARFTKLPAFRDALRISTSVQEFTVEGAFSSDLRPSRALAPIHGRFDVDGADYRGRDDGRDLSAFWLRFWAKAATTSVAITLKAPDGPKVRCTVAEADVAPIRKLCSADLRPLSEDVTGIVRAEREVRLALDTASISENGGVANLTARLHKPRSWGEASTVNETSDVDVYVDVQITDKADDIEVPGTRLTIPAGSRDSNAIALTALDNDATSGNRRIAIAAGTPSEGHVTVDSQTGSVELEIREDDQGLLAPDDFEATPGPEAVRLSWDPSVNMFPHAYEYRYWSTGTAPDWQYIPDSNITEANHSSFTISELARQTSYTFEIRATTGQHQSVARSAEVTTLSEYSVELEPPTHFLPGEAFEVTAVFGSELLRVDGLHHEHTSQVVVQGGTYERLEREGLGRGRRAWDLTIQPDSGATEVTVSVVAEPPPQLRCASDETERICSADRHPLTQGASVTVPVYAAPAFDAGLPASVEVAENTAADTDIGSPFTATDADNDILTWTLDGTDKESFAVDAGTGQLKTKAALDYEARSGYSVTVGVSDGTNSDTHDVSVSVTDVDEPPVKPAAPTVHSRTGTSLTVDWTAPSNEGKPAIESYDLQYRAAGSEGGFTAGPQDVSGTRAQITPLLEATSYQVQVRATNPDGDGEWSDALAAGTDPAVSIAPGSGGETVTEGTDDEAVFVVSRTGVTTGPLTVAVSVTQQGDYIDGTPPAGVTIGASAASAELRVAIDDDDVAEADGSITATVQAGAAYSLDGSTAEATVTVQDEDELALNVNAIAGDDTINIAEKAAGFAIAGDTGSDGGVDVTVTVGGTELTTVSGAADPATWSVSVPGNASYITGPSVEVSVSAARTGVNISPSDVARTLTVDLSAPQAPTYTAPVSLQVGVEIAASPSGGGGIDAYGAEGLPSGLGIDTASGAIGGTPDSADEDTAEVTVTVSDTAGNADTVVIEFPAVEKGDQALAGFQYSSTSVKFDGAAPTVTGPTGAQGALSYSASPDTVCTVNAGTGALTIIGVGRCEVTVTAAGTADYNEATDTFTVEVQPANIPATGAPTISGTALVGERLTAAIDDIADADGLPRTFPDDYTVQWMRVDSDGASNPVNIGTGSSTYILVAADQGKKIKVEVSFQDDDGNDEERTSAAYPSGMETVGAAGPQTRTHVPAGWSLIPSGLGVGDDFRLLFVTSTRRTAGDTGIGAYNAAVRGDVSSHGHTGVQGYSAGFNVLGCTASISAIANTKTASTDPAAPIYWLNGNKVADDYADLYDGSWDSNAPKYSDGTNAPAGTGAAARTFVGCESTGESSSSFYLGASSVGLGYPGGGGSELGTGTAPRTYTHRYYGLSGVFRVVGGSVNTPAYGAPAISGTAVVGQTLSAARGSIGDADGLPSTFPDDYTLQWMRVDSDGASNPVNIGTNSGTYALVTADVGKKIKVEVSFQDTDGNDEVRTSAAYPSGAVLAAASVAPPTVPVTTIPAHWSLKPAAIPDNGTFRLLFVTGNRRTASATAIGDYDQHVQARVVGHGGGDLRDFSALFKVLGCTATVDARDHTGTTSTDTAAPIYWVDGDKVADDYADLYDGRWDSNAPKNASGNPIPAEFGGATVFTGCLASGTRSATPLGATGKASVTEGLPEVSGVEIEGPGVPGSELRKLYGLSSIFRVAASDEPTVASVAVTSTPLAETDTYGAGEQIEFTVTFSEPVEVSASPPHFEFALGPSGNTEDKQATYQGGSGTTALVFAYTVLAADSDDDGIWIGSDSRTLKLDSGEYIRAVDDEASAILVHSSPGTLSDHKVDGSLAPPPATDATLGALSLGTGVTLLPEFASATTEYRAWVANSVASVTVTATTNDEAAAVAIADDDDTATPATATLALAAGRNTVEVTVTAEDTSTIGTYTVTVVRAAAAPAADPAALLTANLTVGETDGFPGYSGFTAPHFGAMSDTDFEVDGVRSALGELRVFGASGVDQFNAETVAACFVDTTATPTPTDAVRNTLVLSIGGESFRFDAATAITANVCYEWVRPAGLSWRWGDIALVKVALAPNAPATPAAPTVETPTDTVAKLAVSWTEPGLNGGPDITGYAVQYREDGSEQWLDWTHSGTDTSATLTGLRPVNKLYQVRVRALNGETASDWSDEGSGRTGLPANAGPLPTGATEIWSAMLTVGVSGSTIGFSDGSYGTLSPDNFDIDGTTYTVELLYKSTGGTFAMQIQSGGVDADLPWHQALHLALEIEDVSDTYWTFSLADDTHAGVGTYATSSFGSPHPVFASGHDGGETAAVKLVTTRSGNAAPVFGADTATREVPENMAANADVGAVVTATDDDGDTLTYTLEGTDAASFAIDTSSGRIKTKAALDHETKASYSVTVKADDGFGGTDTIDVTIEVTNVEEQAGKPAAPTVEAPADSVTSLDVSWTAPELNGGPEITGYEVQYLPPGTEDEVEDEGWLDWTHTGTDTSTTITALTERTEYKVRVRALNGDTPSEWSDAGEGTTGTLPPNATGEPAISGAAVVGVMLTASPGMIEDEDGLNGASYSYHWIRVDEDGSSNAVEIMGATSSTYTLTPADEGKKVKVTASFNDDRRTPEARTSDPYPAKGTVRGPAIAIAPSQSKATGRFDAIVYTLERTGPTTEAAAVTVTLAPPAGNDWGIPANNLSHDVAFGAGESSKRLFISLRSSGGANVGFSATATTSGTLVASLSNVTGYDTTDTAEVEVVVTANPSWIVKLTQSSFSYAEGGGAQTVTIEAYAASADMPAPSVPLGASFVTEAGTASSPGDYAAVSEPVSIAPAAFSADADGIRRGQSTVTFTPEQDSVEEGNETLSFKLSGTSNDPSGVVQYEGPDGTRGEEATYPVTIIDDEDDTTPPELSSATVDRTSLVLTYNEDLDTDSTPAAIAFRVMVAPAGGGEATRRDLAAGNPVMVSGKAVTLTLVSAVVDSETVTVSYTVPTEADANYIRDKAEINAAALANRAVTNESPDTTDPMFLSATINRTSVVLTFNEALDESSVPAASAFLVIPPPTLTNVAVSGRTVTFTATPGYEFGYQGPFLRYTKPSTGPIQDLAGNHASDYLGLITNITPDAPELVTATVNGASLVLRYDRALAEGPVPEASAFTVTVAGSSRDLDPNTPVTVNGPRVTLALSSAVTAGQTVTVSYIAPPNNPIVDTEGNVALALTNQVVTNETTEPMLQSATVNGDSLVLTYDEALDEDSEPPPGAFTVSVDSGPGTAPSTVDVSGATVTLTLVSAVTDGQTVTVSYTVPPTNRVRNLGENDAAALSGRGATNVTLAAPANLSALADSGLVDLTWDPPASDTDVTRHEYRYRAQPGGTWPETWTEIPDSARDAANEGSYRVTGLSDGATYAFQLRAANDRGPGGTAEVTAVVKLRLIARFERRVLNNLGLLDESHPVRSRGHVRMVFKTGVVPQGLTEEDFEVINGAFTGFQIRNTVLDTVLLADTDATEITIALDEDAITNTGGNVAQQMTYAVLPQPAVTLSTDVTEPVTGAFDIVLDFNGPVVEDDGRQELFGAFAFTSVSVTNGATGASAGLATGSTRLRGSIIPRDDFEGELTVHVPAGKFAYWDEFAVLSAASNRLRLRVDTRFPKVVSVAVTSTPSASRDTYAAGEKIELTVTFSEEVEVSTDRPHFEFALGPSGNAVSKEAAYETGSGTTALVFAYTVQESDSDPDGIWVGDPARTLVLESGEYIRSAADMQDAVLDHAELGTQAGHNVDGSLTPGVPEVSIAPAQSEVTEGTAARFELTRVGRLGRLTVAVSVTETGSMIAGTAPAQAVFDAGARSVTLTVLTTDDSADEAHSTVSAEVGAGTGYTTGPDATARVLVKDDDAGVDFSLPVGTFAVPLDWDLNPPGLVVDDSFRLLIVTSTRRTQFAGDIAAYDTYVRNNVRNTGHTAIREYGAGFRVVGCTSSVDADDHTATTYSVADPGVPIYWLDGDRVAGDFRDFYDGAWDSNAPRYPDGTTVATSGEYGHVLTGCTGSGQRLIDHTLGSELPEFGVPGQNGRELESTHTDSLKARSFYGLSPLFRITGVPFVDMVAISSTAPGGDDVYETGDAIRITVTFNEAVTVDTLGGTPELALTIGERTRNAAYSAGDSSATALVFTYTVVAQDSDEDGVSVAGSALMLIGSAIHRQGDAAVAAATALRALPGQAMHRVTTPPMLQSAAVDGASLVLTYDEDLDEGSVPPRDAFTVSVAGAARALAANDPVDVSGKTVTLTLATAAEHGQTVTVTYTVPTGTDPKPIRDVAQNNAAALAGQAVTNTAANAVPAFTAGLATTLSVAENSALETDVGSPFTATDADTGDTLTYTLEGTPAGGRSRTRAASRSRTRASSRRTPTSTTKPGRATR